jgi:Protein of unknown function DUF262
VSTEDESTLEDFDEVQDELSPHTARDVEESEALLDDQYEVDPVGFWEAKQRDLLTSAVDYNLSSLSTLIRNRQIDLSPRYQRRNRWKDDRRSRLMESFLMNVPVPPVFLNEDEYGHYSVIDGKQRLTAINDFMLGRFRLAGLKVFGELNGKSLDELPRTLQTILETRANLRAIIILRQSDPDIKYQVFQRLNTGGIRLNPQEIRNSAWPGLLNTMILDESASPAFHTALGIRDRSRSALYREMRDAEFVLRFLTFRSDWETFTGGMGRRLDTYMFDNHAMGREQVEKLREEFRVATRRAVAAFGQHTFQRWQPERSAWRQQVLAALYDAEMFGVMDFTEPVLLEHQDRIIGGLKNLSADRGFRKSIDAATNTPSYFKQRITMVREMVREAVA